MDCEFRLEGRFYCPKPGEIVLHIRDYSGRLLNMVATDHDGSKESLRRMNSALRLWADRQFCCMSAIQSLTYFRTKKEDFGVVSTNGKHIEPMNSVEGRAIQFKYPDAIQEVYGD